MKPIRGLISGLWRKRLVRFLCVGTFNTLLDFTLLNIFFGVVHLPALAANSCSVTISVSLSYFLNHRIVFRDPDSFSLRKYLKFFLVTGLGVIIIQDAVIFVVSKVVAAKPGAITNVAGVTIATKTLELNISKAIAVIIGLLWNFLLYKYVVFRGSGPPTKNPDEIIVA